MWQEAYKGLILQVWDLGIYFEPQKSILRAHRCCWGVAKVLLRAEFPNDYSTGYEVRLILLFLSQYYFSQGLRFFTIRMRITTSTSKDCYGSDVACMWVTYGSLSRSSVIVLLLGICGLLLLALVLSVSVCRRHCWQKEPKHRNCFFWMN